LEISNGLGLELGSGKKRPYGGYYHSIYTVSQKSNTSYFANYFRTGLTDCKNFNGYRIRDNKRTQVCNVISVLIFNVPMCCHLANYRVSNWQLCVQCTKTAHYFEGLWSSFLPVCCM